MRYILLAAVATLVGAPIAAAHADNIGLAYIPAQPVHTGTSFKCAPSVESNAASLNALLAEWYQAGFSSPDKPGQYRVYGRDGYVTSGPGYDAMVSLIRSAVREAQQGHARAEAVQIAQAKKLLDATSPSARASE